MKSKGLDFFFHPTNSALSLDSLSGNISFESILFFSLGLLLFFVFRPNILPSSYTRSDFSFRKTSLLVKDFFQTYIYYVGFIFLYFSIYLILSHFGIGFHYFLLFTNLLGISAFFLRKDFSLFQDLIKVNTILSALYFIVFYLYSFSLQQIIFTKIDFLNSFLVLLAIILNIYFDIKNNKKNQTDAVLTLYFTLYFFLFVSFYSFLLFDNLLFILSITGFLFSFSLYYFSEKIHFIKNHTQSLKVLSILISYVTIIFSCLFLYYELFNIVIISLLFALSLGNLSIHKNYQNYPSLVMGLSSFGFLSFFLCFEFFIPLSGALALLLLAYTISFCLLVGLYLYRFYHAIDYVIISLFALFFQLFGVISFFLLSGFDILTFGSILFLESISFFAIYYKLNPLLKPYASIHEKHEHTVSYHH